MIAMQVADKDGFEPLCLQAELLQPQLRAFPAIDQKMMILDQQVLGRMVPPINGNGRV